MHIRRRLAICFVVVYQIFFLGLLADPIRIHSTSQALQISDSTCNVTDGQEIEHVVILSQNAPPITDVFYRLSLSINHSQIRHIYNNSAFRGFSIVLHPNCVPHFAESSDILQVEKSVAISHLQSVQTRAHATWGLQRISSSEAIVGNSSTMDYLYSFTNPGLGEGADIYIVDTGIDIENQAFKGRARLGYSFEEDTSDGNGHGTHVSGTAASYVFGVASGANLIAVKVLGNQGEGTTASTIAGIDFVITEHERRRQQQNFIGSVMNMSWGLSGVSYAIAHALNAAVEQGIHAAVAAGNDGANACNNSPASSGGTNSSSVITVGSIGENSEISSFSNTGPCVDIYAPGENILSTWLGRYSANYLAGTSMATPHVTGIIAYLMVAYPELAGNPVAMKTRILQMSLSSTISGDTIAGDSQRLLNNGVRALTSHL